MPIEKYTSDYILHFVIVTWQIENFLFLAVMARYIYSGYLQMFKSDAH